MTPALATGEQGALWKGNRGGRVQATSGPSGMEGGFTFEATDRTFLWKTNLTFLLFLIEEVSYK